MLTPLSRLRDAANANPRASMVTVYAGDVQDVAGDLDQKAPSVKKLIGLVASAERPGVQVRVPADALKDVLDLASRPPAPEVPATEGTK